MTGAFAGHCLAPCDLRSLGLGSLPASLPVAWSLAAPMLFLTFGHSAMGAFQLPCFLLRYRCPVLCRVLLPSRFLRSCLLVLPQLAMLRLDILWMSQRWLLGFGVFLAFFCCGVLAHFAALCILVFMPLQRSQLSSSLWLDLLMSQELSPGFRVFFAALFGGFFCPPRGGPLHHVRTPVWTCMVLLLGYRPSLAVSGGWHTLKKKKQKNR